MDHQPVGIFWDIENYAPPSNAPGHTLPHKIHAIANRFGTITVFNAYLPLHTWEKSPKLARLRSELQSSGVSIIDCPQLGASKKEVADKRLLLDVMVFALDNPPPAVIVVVSGDGDFAPSIAELRNRRYYTVLITPKNEVSRGLLVQANIVFSWNQLFGPGGAKEPAQLSVGLGDAPCAMTVAFPPGASFDSPDDAECSSHILPPSFPAATAASSAAQVSPSVPHVGLKMEATDSALPSSMIALVPRDDPVPFYSINTVIPPIFWDLVDALALFQYIGVDFPLWRTIEDVLLRRDPDFLENNKLSLSTHSLDWAVQEEIVQVGQGWPCRISLHRRIQIDPPASHPQWPEHPSESSLSPVVSRQDILSHIESSPSVHSYAEAHYTLENYRKTPTSDETDLESHTTRSPPGPTPVHPVFRPHGPSPPAEPGPMFSPWSRSPAWPIACSPARTSPRPAPRSSAASHSNSSSSDLWLDIPSSQSPESQPALPVPTIYKDLVAILEEHICREVHNPLCSIVADALRRRNPNIFLQAGVPKWKGYLAKAEADGIVRHTRSGSAGEDRVSLNDRVRWSLASLS